jgi:hypothetical protein
MATEQSRQAIQRRVAPPGGARAVPGLIAGSAGAAAAS